MSCKRCPLCPAARCSVVQWVRVGWVCLLRGKSTKQCWILYILVSLAVCLRCSQPSLRAAIREVRPICRPF